MATTTSVSASAGEWTLAYTAAGTVTLHMQPRSANLGLLVRIGSATATSDSLDAAAEYINPGELRAIPLASGDKVHVRPACNAADVVAQAVSVTLRV